MKICLVKTSSMGDVLHTLPALTDARNAIAGLQADWVIEESFAEIPRWHAAVNQVIPVALRRWRRQLFSDRTRNEWKSYRTLLQSEQYDAVIDAQGLIKSALFAAGLAKGRKHGYDRHSIREPLASFFYDQKHNISCQQHAVERIRQLFARSLNYPLPDTMGDYGIAQHFTESESAVPFVLFFHGTTRADKLWPLQNWRKLAEKLTALGIAVRLPWHGEEEKRRAELIAQNLSNALVLPQSDLTALARQIAQARAVISVDTGLAHLTAALDKTNITLYGATDPKLIGTYGKNQSHLKAASTAEISVDEVFTHLQSAV